MRATIEAAGFRLLPWDDVTDEKDLPAAVRPKYMIQKLVMGHALLAEIRPADQRNDKEKRLVMIQAVFQRIWKEDSMSTLRQLIGQFKLQWRGKNHIVGWNMTPEAAIAFCMGQRKAVLTFYGYSGMGYEDEEAMLEIARKVLSGYSPETTLVNIGVTSVGIGAIYPLAKSMGFETAGIVTSLALDHPAGISEAVDHICFVVDKQWGGNLPDSDQLSPTSRAMVECSDILVGIGGGGIVNAEMLAGKAQGKPIYFYPADMNHAAAIRYAKRMGLPPPESFRGSDPDIFRK